MPVHFLPLDSSELNIRQGDIHIYSAPITEPAAFWPVLSETEKLRAERFRSPRVRTQFVATRGQLRVLLGKYTALDPHDVEIWYADGGKPTLPPRFSVQFNVSHTDGIAVIAFARETIGVDVERVRVIQDAAGLVARFFSPREIAVFETLSADDHQTAFLNAWTRKEAVLKAIARGVQSLDRCDVSFLPNEEPRLLELDGDPTAGERFELVSWEPAPGFIAAVARHHN